MQALYDDISSGAFPDARQLHLHQMAELRPYLGKVRSHKTCLSCLFQTPEKALTCGHTICDTCIRCFGDRCREAKHTFGVACCPYCGENNQKNPIGLIPPTAGIRALSLDGGGVRGIITLMFVRGIEEILKPMGVPFPENFDFICGTSTGEFRCLNLRIQINPVRRRSHHPRTVPHAMDECRVCAEVRGTG